MYYHKEAKLVFLAHPRTASVATSLALRDCGFVLLDGYGHHTLLNRAKFVMKERDKWTVFSTVRNHWDAVVSWIMKTGYYGEIAPNGEECRIYKADFSLECMKKTLDLNGFVKDGRLWGHHHADVDVWFRYETVERALRSWLLAFDITLPSLPLINQSGSRHGRHYRDYYSDLTRAYIGERFKEEIAEFGYRY